MSVRLYRLAFDTLREALNTLSAKRESSNRWNFKRRASLFCSLLALTIVEVVKSRAQTFRRLARLPERTNQFIFLNAVQDDEFEHVKTMVACQDGGQPIISPNRVKATLQE